MSIISPEEYCRRANASDSDFVSEDGCGYAYLPDELLAAQQSVARQDQAAAFTLNKILCRTLLERFTITDNRWVWPDQFHVLYGQQLQRIESQLSQEPESYFSFSNDPFRKDLAILRHRLIPFGAEFATPFSAIPRSLLIRGGWLQAIKFIRVVAFCGGIKPFLELHMHQKYTAAFNPEGWLETYENLADFLALNPSLLGVKSTSWFLDPAIEQVSPHLAYLRRVPEQCGATFLYAGEDNGVHSGAFATSRSRRALFATGKYFPMRYTRIWPRQKLLQRRWRSQ